MANFVHLPGTLKKYKTILTKSSFKDSGQNSEKKKILMLWDASVTLRGILQKNIDEASKKNNFQKKVYRKIFIFRGDRSFSRAKKCNISPKIRVIFNGKSMEIDFPSFSTSIDFLLKITRIFGKMLHFFALENDLSPRYFLTPHRYFFAESHVT